MKFVIDFILSFIALILLSPFLFIISIVIILDSKGPVLYFQDRLGKNKVPFKIIKFRTMTHKMREHNSQVYSTNPEITKLGYWLRRFKIDELPQIINILRGDMSIVGPRPALSQTIKKYNLRENRRFDVKPGLTSIAGINGSIYLSWEKKWQYDKEYVENLSFWLDIKIILKTIFVVLLGEKKFKNKHII